MATELFNGELSLNDIHSELMEHLQDGAYITIHANGKIRLNIPENGECSWWFNDLIETILQKVANGDSEIVKICIEKEINLFEVKKKK